MMSKINISDTKYVISIQMLLLLFSLVIDIFSRRNTAVHTTPTTFNGYFGVDSKRKLL